MPAHPPSCPASNHASKIQNLRFISQDHNHSGTVIECSYLLKFAHFYSKYWSIYSTYSALAKEFSGVNQDFLTVRQTKTAGRVAFLAQRDAILAELAKGWSMSEVYRQLSPHLPIGLRQFQIYVKRYLVDQALPRLVAPASAAPPATPKAPHNATATAAPALAEASPPAAVARPGMGLNRRDLY
ncbi:TraK family protein [Nitrospirillum sp. BR 11752]|uniref:TraK family protein n=1 Tax=Nitrospirillum sp. BR 11752 TaxID=3104293 RepID=UPI002EA8C22E|nr:TraK family protein [Nitrospirillum sp. BR 11752]